VTPELTSTLPAHPEQAAGADRPIVGTFTMPTARLTALLALIVSTIGVSVLAGPVQPVQALAAARTCAQRSPGFHTSTFRAGGVVRSYTVYVPSTWSPAGNRPSVWVLQGSGGEAEGTIWGSKLKVQADQDGFVVVAPQGLGLPSSWDVSTTTLRISGSDAAMFTRLPAKVASDWCLDPSRQCVAGYSAGSVVTHAMACRGGFPFAGYAGAAAQSWLSSCPTLNPFDFVYFHGTADPYVPFGGDASLPSVPASLAEMASADACEASPAVTSIGPDITQYTWTRCAAGRRLLLDVLQGGGHVWPGADYVPGLGNNTTTISADQVVSDFWHLAS